MNISLANGINYSSSVTYSDDGFVRLSDDTSVVLGKWESTCKNTVSVRLPLGNGKWSDPMGPMPRSLADDYILTFSDVPAAA